MVAKREVSLNIRLLRKEHAAWRKAARGTEETLSDWIRTLCNTAAVPPPLAPPAGGEQFDQVETPLKNGRETQRSSKKGRS